VGNIMYVSEVPSAAERHWRDKHMAALIVMPTSALRTHQLIPAQILASDEIRSCHMATGPLVAQSQ
jgi:hypothetical protein